LTRSLTPRSLSDTKVAMQQTYERIDSTGKLFVEFGSYMCADTHGPAFDTV